MTQAADTSLIDAGIGAPRGPEFSGLSTAWRPRLYDALRAKASPLMVFDDRIIPAASVWTGARVWTGFLRANGIAAGDRVVLALEPSPAMLMALVACLWEGVTIALAPPGSACDLEAIVSAVDARACIARHGEHAIVPDHDDSPQSPQAWRTPIGPRTPDARLLMRTSGTTGLGKWIALSDGNILSVIDSHSPALALGGATILSTLPWHHAFGLVIDLLPALFSGASVIRDSAGGRDPCRIADLSEQWGVTSLSTVPLVAERLIDSSRGRDLINGLQGGVIGGAPVSARLTDGLRGTRFRVGYGLTEAAPGVCVGHRGEFQAGFIGRPVRCRVKTDEHGVLWVRGENVCLGHWSTAGLERLDPDRWLRTGDVVEPVSDDDPDAGWRFLGRADDRFKLDNGKFVDAPALERAVLGVVDWASEAAVHSPEGRSLEVVLLGDRSASSDEQESVRRAFGTLAERVSGVRTLRPDLAPRTSKGVLDRRRLAA